MTYPEEDLGERGVLSRNQEILGGGFPDTTHCREMGRPGFSVCSENECCRSGETAEIGTYTYISLAKYRQIGTYIKFIINSYVSYGHHYVLSRILCSIWDPTL